MGLGQNMQENRAKKGLHFLIGIYQSINEMCKSLTLSFHTTLHLIEGVFSAFSATDYLLI